MSPANRGSGRLEVRRVARCAGALALGAACLAPAPPPLAPVGSAPHPVRLARAGNGPYRLCVVPNSAPSIIEPTAIDRCLVAPPALDARFVVSAPEVDPAMILAPRVQGRPVGSPVFLVPAP